MSSHLLTNFKIQKYYKKTRFDLMVLFSRVNIPKIKDGAYIINLYEYPDTGTHWVVLYVSNSGVTYFNSFRVEHIPKDFK